MLCPYLSFLLMHGFESRLAGDICHRYSQTFPVNTLRNAWRKSHFVSVGTEYTYDQLQALYIYIYIWVSLQARRAQRVP